MTTYLRKFFAKMSLQRLENRLDKDLQVSDEDVTIATNNRSEANLIGQGTFGLVYHGKIGGQEVAIKFLKPEYATVVRKELSSLVRFQHENLIRLYGYNRSFICLILEFATLGTLRDAIDKPVDKKVLTLDERVNICLGTARGLEYLHTAFEKALVHRDISSGNVLLDKDRKAKISDFGLARSVQVIERESICATAFKACGTHGYMPPEAKYGVVSRKYDVYGFGVLVLEIISALYPYSTKRSPHMLSDMYFQNKNRNLPFPKDRTIAWPDRAADALFEIAEKCLHIKSKRAYIDEICDDLEVFIRNQATIKNNRLSREISENSISGKYANEYNLTSNSTTKSKDSIADKDKRLSVQPAPVNRNSKPAKQRPLSEPAITQGDNTKGNCIQKSKNQPKSGVSMKKTIEPEKISLSNDKLDEVDNESGLSSPVDSPPHTSTEDVNLAQYTTDV